MQPFVLTVSVPGCAHFVTEGAHVAGVVDVLGLNVLQHVTLLRAGVPAVQAGPLVGGPDHLRQNLRLKIVPR